MVTSRRARTRGRHSRPSSRASFFKKGTATLGTVGLVATGLFFGTTAAQAAVPVEGTVFLDYGGDGAYTQGVDTLLGDVAVTAYDSSGAVVGEARTTVNATTGESNYSMSASVDAGEPLRIEFTELPSGMYDTFNIDAGQASVQFVTPDASGAVVDYGIFDANQYSPIVTGDAANPTLSTAIMTAGARTNGLVSDEPALVGTLWNVGENVTGRDGRWEFNSDEGKGGHPSNNTQSIPDDHSEGPEKPWAQREEWASYEDVGSVYSMASDPATRSVYAAAAYKRMAELGPEGLGGIYIVQNAVDEDGKPNPKADTTLLSFNVEDLGINVGSGDIVDQGSRGLGAPNALLTDVDPFEQAAKVGIGGIAIDTDAQILYMVNLYDKKVYAIDISDPTEAKKVAEFATPAGANQRAFALAIHQGNLYVGYNDTGEDQAFRSASDVGMKYYVERTPLLDEGLAFAPWERVLDNGDLGYQKGNPAAGWGNNPGASSPQVTRWNSWTDTWSSGSNSVGIPDQVAGWGNIHVYPQPLLSGITFDREGFMTLGFLDRSQFQSGNQNCVADAAAVCTPGEVHITDQNKPQHLWQTLASGDILIAAPVRSDDQQKLASWNPESDGVATGDPDTSRTGRVRPPAEMDPSSGEGPGGREFFEDRQWYSSDSPGNHREIALGSVVAVPGTADQVASNAYDPLEPVRAVGIQWFDLQDGDRARGYQHTWDPGDPVFNNTRSSFQKGGGMGGLTLLAKQAPVEIGDRVWLDLDLDGIQDAGEPSIEGAQVALYTANSDGTPGTFIADTTTDQNGRYLFNSEHVPGLLPNTDYVVVFLPGEEDDVVDLNWHGADQPPGFTAPTWGALSLTEQGAKSDLYDDDHSIRDSNPDENGHAPVSVGAPGANDHTIDAGWGFRVVTVGDYVWLDKDHNGKQDDGEDAGIEGVLLEIFLIDGDSETKLTVDSFGDPFTKDRTDADGHYLFENLPVLEPGQYYEVRIDRDDPQTQEALEGLQPTLEGEGDRTDDSSTWVATTENEDDEDHLTVPGAKDLTLDFGFYQPTYAIGDVVWVDRNEDGIQDDGEQPLTDVVVKLLDANEDPVLDGDGNPVTTVTDDEGRYLFDELPAGQYIVEFELPDGYHWTVANSEEVDATVENDSDADETTGRTGVITLGNDSVDPDYADQDFKATEGVDPTWDAGVVPDSVSVGDRVWHDTINPDEGTQDRDDDGNYLEPGIDGVELKIVDSNGDPVTNVFGEPVENQVTENGGLYEFTDLPVLDEGDHYTVIVVSYPDKYTPTTEGAGNGAGEFDSSTDEANSQADLSEHGAKDLTLDFGFVLKTPGATIMKTDGNGADADTEETAVDLGPTGGETEINFTIPNTGNEPLTNIGLVDVTADNTSGEVQYPISCEIEGTGTTFELISADARWDGSLAVGETLLCETTLTGVLPGGDHLNTVTLWADGEHTGKPVEDPENPSDDPENPNRPEDPFNAKYKTYAIGDYVWIDSNANGVQDEGESAFTEGTTVNLWKLDENGERVGDDPIDTTTTDDEGYYFFDELAAGEYEVEFQLPSGYFWTTSTPADDADGDETNDSNALWTEEDQEWAATVGITLDDSNEALDKDYAAENDLKASEGVDPTWDAGVIKRVPGATIDKSDDSDETANDGDTAVDLGPTGSTTIVFTIVNTGAEPLTEIGLADVTTSGSGELQYPIILEFEDGSTFELEDADARWDGDLARGATLIGKAQLTGVKAGETHRNEVTLHAEGSLTGDPVLTPDPEDPDAPGTPPTDEYNGRVPSYAIGDYVWLDADRDGIQGDDEDPIEGVVVNLLDGSGDPVLGEDGEPITDVTDEDGFYLFDNLVEGSYIVEFVLPDGEYRWTDANQDDDESLDGSDAEFTESDDATAQTRVINLGKDSPLTELGDQDGLEFEATEGIDQTWDAGIIERTYAIGDVVWIDRNENGIQDEGELPLADVVVNLLDAEGDPVRDSEGEPITTVTDSEGRYLFDDLPAGEYIVEFELPSGYHWTVQNSEEDGATAENDSDADETTGQTGVITLGQDSVDPDYTDQPFKATEGVDPTWDAGVVPDSVSVGDFVWLDEGAGDNHGNGLQDVDEQGINDVELTLTVKRADGSEEPVKNVYGEDVDPVRTATNPDTGIDGFYEFIDLPVLGEGESYVVTVTDVDPQYKPTKEGTNNGEDDNDSSTDFATSVLPLTNDGDRDPTLDFGFVTKTPTGDILKTDADEEDADTADEAVDLGPTGGATTINVTITNPEDAEEPITNIALVDVSEGGTLEYPFVCVSPTGDTFELENDSDSIWMVDGEPGVLEAGESIVCEIDLTDVPVGKGTHTNTVTLWAEGALTGKPVVDPENPGDPENPNRPEDPFNAERLTYGIGDIVWVDRDQNGQQDNVGQDGGEAPIEGVTVTLYEADGTTPATDVYGEPVDPVTTDADGRYLFDELAAGDYVVEFTLPDGYKFTEQNADGVPGAANSDADVNSGKTGVIALGNDSVTDDYADQEFEATEGVDPTWDAGVIPHSVSVGDFVWHDLDGNGTQDDGEPGIQGVTLTLTGPNGEPVANVYGEPVEPVQTDESGNYEFVDLPVLEDGQTYTVTISDVPAKFKPTEEGENGGAGEDDSSTGSATSVKPLTTDGANDPTLDFGFVLKVPGATIDKSDSEARPGDDSANPVDLSPTDGEIGINFTVTNNGEEPITKIGLADVSTGSGSIAYPLVCEAPDGSTFTLDSAQAFWTLPEGVDNGDDSTDEGEEDPENGGDDANGEENGETGPEGDDTNGEENGETDPEGDDTNGEENGETDPEAEPAAEDGYGVLDIGESILCEGLLTGVVAGQPHNNVVTLHAEGALSGSPVEDPDNPGNPPTDEYNAQVKTYAIGDYVWIDQLNRNNVQDDDEPGLAGVVVTLTDADGNQVGAPVTTGADGYYQFDDLKPGDYQVHFDLPRGYVFIEPNAGDDPTVDSDALAKPGTNGTQGATVLVTLDDSNDRLVDRDGVNATEGIDPTWDAGVRLAEVSVGDFIWEDVNRDGIQDDGEPGIPGVVVVIERTDGEPVTDVDGNPVDPETTDDDGQYSFDELPILPEGVDYVVKIDREASKDALGDLIPTKPGQGEDRGKDSSTWEETATGLENDGDEDKTLDFGFVKPSVTVGDRVWEDRNKDGIQTPGEPGIKGVVLEITGPDGEPVTDVFGNPVGPQTTKEDGSYLFPDLPALAEDESYTVTIDREASKDALEGFEPTEEGAGDDREVDSSTWSETTEGLNADGDEDLTLDFGFIRPSVTVGDKVWKDINRDGRQDKGEPGIPGVVVTITGPDGKPVTDVFGNPVGPQTTDKNGNYKFTELPILEEGESYTVTIDREASKDALGNMIPTQPGVGDRVGDSSTWSETTEGLNADGDEDLTLDFGFVVPSVTVGDKVWKDINRDGRQDKGEPGISGVVLEIRGPDGKPVTDVFGNPVGPQKTDKDGNYLFTDLPALADGESYTVRIDRDASAKALGNMIPTLDGVGDRAGDSSTWSESTEGLNADGDEDLTLDFGFVVPSVTVGDKVWLDTNRNGRQDDGEPGIKGVVLEIRGPDGKPVTDVFGNPVGPQKTDKDGNYLFTDLPALADGESYTVRIDRDASAKALGNMIPTLDGVGDRAGDSSTWSESTEGLTADGDEDLTLDFGFVLPEGEDMPPSGLDLDPAAWMAIILGLIGAGGALTYGVNRRRQNA